MEIYQHFRKEEQPFIDQVINWKEDVERMYQRKLSDFLDPRERFIFQSIIGHDEELSWETFGGYTGAERQRVVLAPFYETIKQEDFNVTLLEATYPSKFVTLEHRDVLGAFMSLGIRREKVGDLIVTDNRIQIIVATEIASYVMMNLTGIKKAGVEFEEKDISNLLPKKEEWMEQSGTVSSLRLDTILKEIYNVSRQKAALHIQKGHVKVNFRTVEDSSFLLEASDMISFRGKGRSQLLEVEGRTKKDKWRITTAVLK
ncbi:RNA-binding protein [Pontibacillus yanchengensis]|uniref:RNA-binding protein n=2 Tax=Pontibacillus yanchengensis TaxID=462910 RepID=A0ACC7VBP8_9BACI|nr:RNA-binding protein [Pontibacillus yanchengensis]MYL33064.1 RNA-binding protein [Pontibacillus yanchengensis]MYL52085.1 RNA-binding protein [Pontibacillus yanchengensis]